MKAIIYRVKVSLAFPRVQYPPFDFATRDEAMRFYTAKRGDGYKVTLEVVSPDQD